MSTDAARSVTFEEASTIRGTSSHAYSGRVHRDFSFGPAAHGGFLISLCWRAVTEHFSTTLASYSHLDTISLHVEFLRPATNGPVEIKLSDLRLGKGSSTVSFNLQQNGKEVIAGFATNVNLQIYRGITISLDYSVLPHLKPIDFDKLEANTDPNWVMYNIPYRPSTMNMALSQVNFGMPRRPNPDKGINEHWISCVNPAERWHNNMLGLLFDHGVPPMENYFPDSPHSAEANAAHASTWMTEGPPPPEQHHSWTSPRHYPTANMTIDVKHGLPKEGAKWVFVRLQTKGVVEGRLDMITEIWDVQGRLVAIAQSLSLVVDLRRAMITKLGRKDGSKI